MHTETHVYHHNDLALHGHLAYDNTSSIKRPAVLVVHDWSGRNAFACEKANMLAEIGYVGLAVDMYGNAQQGQTTPEKQALMQPLTQDRLLLQARITSALLTVSALPMVDTTRIAVIGFCFGGLCALDLARTGAPIVGAVSFHGLLTKPQTLLKSPINASVLVLHGYDDPMVSPADVQAFCEEMTHAHVDWQVQMYGQTKHAFMVPSANDASLGTIYQPRTEQRAWHAMVHFLKERFES